MLPLEPSDFVTLVVIVPESHADLIRETLAKEGAGESVHYSHGSFSSKGISRFMPKDQASPYSGEIGKIQEVQEERIETICTYDRLEKVLQALKKAHPYEETVIDIYPIYQLGYKRKTY